MSFRCRIVCQQRIRFRCRNCVVCSELVFAAETMLSAVNQRSLLKLCYLQRTNVRCRKCVVCSKSAFVAEVMLSAFAAEVLLPAVKHFFFTIELCGLQWNSFRCRIGWLAANLFRCRFSTIDSPGINDLSACNNFILWWGKMWNTWMWTNGLLK